MIGTFVFNQNFRLREKVLFKDAEIIKNYELLKEGKTLDSEKKFIEKFSNIVNLREDGEELYRVYKELEQFKDKFYEKNIMLTRQQIKMAVSEDNLIIQASDAIEEINRTANVLVKRLREWFSFYLPELENKIKDHEHFVELVLKDKEMLMKEFKIIRTMGAELKKDDEKQIVQLAETIIILYKEKESKENYLEKIMKKYAPNLTKVAGYSIGAQLIALGGSLKNLVMMPASTVQLLGAEKALFRHMRNKSIRPPKHGIIFNHEILQKTKPSKRGKAARRLSDKLSMAVKVDYFKGDFIGDKLRKELEKEFLK